ncbi:hypothetical protein FGB62_430g02 [Gracilaria domingensis]|nr:hypothetical protein FGB62_430g02 [Gracilaria domingensis]
MTGQVLLIENLVNIGDEEAYLLAEEEGDNSGDLDVTQKPDALMAKNAGAPNKDHQKPLAPQTSSHSTSVVQHEEEEDNMEPATKISDVNVLLDIIEEHEPTGMNGWALVHQALKEKYDKLQYYQKRTSDPTCPDYVRRAKNIQKEILSKMVCQTYNSNLEEHIGLSVVENEGIEGASEEQSVDNNRDHNVIVSARKRPLNRPSYISPSKRRELELQDTIKDLTKSMKDLYDVQTRRGEQQLAVEDRDMDSLVKEVVEQSRYTIQAIVSSSIEETIKLVMDKSHN